MEPLGGAGNYLVTGFTAIPSTVVAGSSFSEWAAVVRLRTVLTTATGNYVKGSGTLP